MVDSTLAIATARAPKRGVGRILVRRPLFWAAALVLTILVAIAAFPSVFANLFGNGDPFACDLANSRQPPTDGHPFGFDLQGCDVWATAIYGARSSLLVGVIAVLIASTIAIAVGILAGLAGGVVDWFVSRVIEIFLGFPFLLAAIVVLNTLGERTVWTVSLVLGVFGWPLMARLMRTSVRGIRNTDYTVAARTMGLGWVRIVRSYILPNAVQPVIVLATITTGGVIVAESTLTYLGIGLQAPAFSWGLQIGAAARVFQSAPHTLILPAILLALTVTSIVALGEELRTAFDPKEGR